MAACSASPPPSNVPPPSRTLPTTRSFLPAVEPDNLLKDPFYEVTEPTTSCEPRSFSTTFYYHQHPFYSADPCNYVAVNLGQIDIKEQHSFLLFYLFVIEQQNGIDVASCCVEMKEARRVELSCSQWNEQINSRGYWNSNKRKLNNFNSASSSGQ